MKAIFFIIRFPFFLLGLPFVILFHIVISFLSTVVWILSPIPFALIIPFKFLGAAFANKPEQFTSYVEKAVTDWFKHNPTETWFSTYWYGPLFRWLLHGSG